MARGRDEIIPTAQVQKPAGWLSSCHAFPVIREAVYFWPKGGRAYAFATVPACSYTESGSHLCYKPQGPVTLDPKESIPGWGASVWAAMCASTTYFGKFYCESDDNGGLKPYGVNGRQRTFKDMASAVKTIPQALPLDVAQNIAKDKARNLAEQMRLERDRKEMAAGEDVEEPEEFTQSEETEAF